MEMLFYLILGAVLYGFVADRADRAVEREMHARRRRSAADLRLVEDFDVRPDLPRGRGWILRRHARVRDRVPAARSGRGTLVSPADER